MADLLPVFVFPANITFYASKQTTHKQVLTIHNPYEFTVQFKVLCSSRDRSKYSVVDPAGTINSNCCVDIVIRHNAVNPQNFGICDKFRVQLYQLSSDQVLGKKDVTAELMENEPALNPSSSGETTQQTGPSNTAQFPVHRRPEVRSGALNTVAVVLAILCGVTLLLPTQGEPSSIISDYLKPTVTQKLVASYALGLFTMFFLRPT